MSLWIIIAMNCLAVFRVTYFLTQEDGPGDLMKKLRVWINSKVGENWSPLNCFYCTSVWVSVVTCLALSLHEWYYMAAFSAIAMFIYQVHERMR